METLKLYILQNNDPVHETCLLGLLEIGRQRRKQLDPGPFHEVPSTAIDSPARLIVLDSERTDFPRKYVWLEPIGANVQITNKCDVEVVQLPEDVKLYPGESSELRPPFRIPLIGGLSLFVSRGEFLEEFNMQGLDDATIGPGSLPNIAIGPGVVSNLSRLIRHLPSLTHAQTNELVRWLQLTMSVLQRAVGSADFLTKAAESLVEIVGLDSGRILLLRDETWTPIAASGAEAEPGRPPSKHVLNRVREEKRTFWQRPKRRSNPDWESIFALDTVVASPLLDGEGKVIGALYGERREEATPTDSSIVNLEAILVDLLACGVSAGLARQEAVTEKVLLGQFFPKALIDHLRLDPKLLQGKEADVTLLFADIRGFSRVSGILGPAGTMEWISDVLGKLSDCVLGEEGVLVDYIGDELMAMWGAPQPQPDQEIRAVRAALAMRQFAPELQREWSDRLKGNPMEFGIGINTGKAQVGNIGTGHKFKYGPLGDSVNIASRTQGITKYLECGLLVTEATRNRLDDRFLTRHVVTTRLVNIDTPIKLYEVEYAKGPETFEREKFFQRSEQALQALEAGSFGDAARQVGELLAGPQRDGPLLLTLSRAAQMLVNRKATFDPVWEPPGK